MRRWLIALLASTFLTAATVPARAEPITLAILSAVGIDLVAGSVAASVATFALTTAAAAALSLIANALKAKTPETAGPSSGTDLNVQYGGNVPREVILGTAAIGGHHVYSNVYGVGGVSDNKQLQCVFVLSDGQCDGINKMWVNGALVTLVQVDAGPSPVVYETSELRDSGNNALFKVRFFDGRYDQAADTELVTHANPAGRWTTDHRGRGVCYVSVWQYYDEEHQLTGVPSIIVELRGNKLYDPRKDSTVGGSGSHVWGTPSTYEFSGNPAIIEFNFRRGIRVNNQVLVGMDTVGGADLILPMYFSAANDCDDAIPLLEGGTEPRYRCGMAASADKQHSATLDVIRQSMAGFSLERAGQFGPIAGVAQSSVFEFSDADFQVGDKATFSKYETRSNIATAVFGNFSDPAQKWAAVPFPPRESITDDALMGERLAKSLDLTQVSSSAAAQRIAEIERRRSMMQAHGSQTLGADFIGIQPGDWGTYHSPYGDMTVQVGSLSLAGDDQVTFAWRQIASSVFSWTTAGELDPPAVPTAGQPGAQVTAVAGFAASPTQVLADSGLTLPALQIVWTTILDPTIARIDVEYRVVASPATVLTFSADVPSAGVAVISGSVQASTAYELRAKPIAQPERTTTWTAWIAATSGTNQIVKQSKSVVAGGVDFAAFNATLQATLNTVPVALSAALAAITALSPTPAAALATTPLVYKNVWQQIESQADVTMAALLEVQSIRNDMRDAGIKVDPANGRVTLWALNSFKDQYTQDQTNLSVTLDAVRGSINLRATTVQVSDLINAAALGFVKAYNYDFSASNNNSWTGVNATLTAGAPGMSVAVTAVGGYAKTPTIALNATTNKLVQIVIKRTGGTGWGLKLLWGAAFVNNLAFSTPVDPSVLSSIVLSLDGVPAWTGTLTELAVVGDNGTTFEIDSFAVGSSTFQSLALAGIQTRISVVELDISSINGTLTAKANTSTVSALTTTVSGVSLRLDSVETTITSLATTANIAALSSSVTTISTTLDAVRGNLTFLVDTTRETQSQQRTGDALLGAQLQDLTNYDAVRVSLGRAQQTLSSKIDDQGVVVSQLRLDLQAQVGGVAASLASEQTARASAEAALASSITTLQANVGSVGGTSLQAQVTAEISARTGADTTLAASITTLQANVGSVGGTSLQAQVTTEIAARASGDSAIAIDVTTLQTKVGSYTQSATIGAVVSNLYAAYVVTLDVGGHLGGLMLANNGAETTLSILGNVIVDGTISAGKLDALSVVAGNIAAGALNAVNIIADNLIVRGKLQADTATRIDTNSAGATSVAWDGAYHDLVSVTVTSVGGQFTLIGSIDMDNNYGTVGANNNINFFDGQARIIIDNNPSLTKSILMAASFCTINGVNYEVRLKGNFVVLAQIALAAGSHTIKVQAGGTSARTTISMPVAGSQLVVFEARR